MFDLLAVSGTDAGRGTDGRHLIHVVEAAAGAPVALLRHGVATARRKHLSQRGASAEQWSKSGSRRGTLSGPVCAWRHALVDGGRIFIISEASERKGRNTTSQFEHFTTGGSLASFLLRWASAAPTSKLAWSSHGTSVRGRPACSGLFTRLGLSRGLHASYDMHACRLTLLGLGMKSPKCRKKTGRV
ncbi:hypothetical protein MUK42_33286 [Musa troglodytarum]|uniref:Uncharacterized protein n=1 Tax=Musa troglodytarum TaxID=320322 RepID=A0A9E7HYI0_9LILI|nr:hypothetical protein MUK42_33286 [Musa troglodytarum]URE42345.1 hypothetical protein MUK42_33286 [Musa troglodytarum]